MKAFFNFSRSVLYVVITTLCIGFVYFSFGLVSLFLLDKTLEFYDYVNIFLFWFLFLLFGLIGLIWLWQMFKYIASVLIALTTGISPSKKFAVIYTCIAATIIWILFVIYFFQLDNVSLLFKVFVSIEAMLFVYTLSNGIYKLYSKEIRKEEDEILIKDYLSNL